MMATSRLKGKLTGKQRIFVRQYLIHFNGTRAAIEAGYSKKTAQVIGSENFRKPLIADAITKGLDNSGLSLERIKCELAKFVFGMDMSNYAPWLNGKKTLAELHGAGVDTSLIESFSVTPTAMGNARTLRLHSKLRAFELLVRVLGMIENVQRIKGGEDIGKNAAPAITMIFEGITSAKEIKDGKSK